jgi:hypothetical protein
MSHVGNARDMRESSDDVFGREEEQCLRIPALDQCRNPHFLVVPFYTYSQYHKSSLELCENFEKKT